MIEAAKKIEDRMSIGRQFGMIMQLNNSNPLSKTYKLLMKEAGMTLDFNEFQDSFAKAYSDYISKVEKWDPAVDATPPPIRIDLSQTDLPRGQALILNSVLPSNMMLKNILSTELVQREVLTWNAVNQAKAEGLEATALSDLVPDFLTEVPVNPLNNEPFVFDFENRTLNKPK